MPVFGKAINPSILAKVADQATPPRLGELIPSISGATPVVPAPNRWWLNPEANPGPQALIERAIQRGGIQRADMTSGAFIDPRTGEILDGRLYDRGAVVIDPSTGRPSMAVGAEMEASWGGIPRDAGNIADTNLVRRSFGWRPTSGDIDLPFLATVDRGGHFYGTGIAFDAPVMLRNTGGTSNPTLRPRARGSVYGNEQIGTMSLKGVEHPVYDYLRIVPRGTPSSGTLLRYGVLAPLLMQQDDSP